MEYALVIMYLWAGATVAWAMLHVEEIGAALHGAIPDVFPAPQTSMRKKRVAAAVILGWPLVLPVWLRLWHKERSNV